MSCIAPLCYMLRPSRSLVRFVLLWRTLWMRFSCSESVDTVIAKIVYASTLRSLSEMVRLKNWSVQHIMKPIISLVLHLSKNLTSRLWVWKKNLSLKLLRSPSLEQSIRWVTSAGVQKLLVSLPQKLTKKGTLVNAQNACSSFVLSASLSFIHSRGARLRHCFRIKTRLISWKQKSVLKKSSIYFT